MKYWLMKSEPDVFGIDDLERMGRDRWEGVRNYQARNMMRDEMRLGDLAFLYHSNCDEPGVVGVMKIVQEGYPDPSAFDRNSKYYDPKSSPDAPRWYMVDVAFERRLRRTITLAQLKSSDALDGFALVRRGNRLSVIPVEPLYWRYILSLE